MATLNWIGKEAVANHDKEVPFKLLEKVPSASVGKESKNLVIHGDNLEALKALMPFYQGKIKCIYIDPPYNTGNEGWVYNDKVNSPKIREWLSQVVKSDDLTKHDKWLCMMQPRLKLLKELLSDDGFIFVSIDDHEQQYLSHLMNEMFGEGNFVANFIWNHRKSSQNDIDISLSHNYTFCYARNRSKFKLNPLEIDGSKFSNPDNDPRGDWVADPMDAPAIRENLMYPITNPKTKKVYLPPPGRHWRFSKEKFEQAIKDNRILFGKTGNSKPQYKRFKSEAVLKGTNVFTIWDDVGTATEGTQELMDLFDGKKVFDTPKPTSFIKKILKLASGKDSIILDSFAGSGTTAHAILSLNSEEKGSNRKFILVEMEDKVARDITAARVERVIKKYNFEDGFEYCELAKPLFDKAGQINESCSYEELASYIYFTETQTNIDKKAIKNPFIGESHGISYYLVYTGKGKNEINRSSLSKLKIVGQAVIYADRCLVDEDELKEKGITFKQIPYEIKIY
ncbi:MAG: site-specific DNA-methyltransferase [Patescibacteria group bacterium]|nr:site-specific DNA-methyltransferase [Patescibacteria group bacterium]